MWEIKFRSEMLVDLVNYMASDDNVIHAARVSTLGSIAEKDTALRGGSQLIRFLMRNRHSTPFEHNVFQFFISAPIFVFREFQRHRIASYNEESGRYKELAPVFYVPSPERGLKQVGKPGQYKFKLGDEYQVEHVKKTVELVSETAYINYQRLLKSGIAREIARMILPLNIYSTMYVTINARSLMNFLSLRVESSDSTYPSYPMREIEMVAEKMEAHLAKLMPDTHAAFVEFGRVSS